MFYSVNAFIHLFIECLITFKVFIEYKFVVLVPSRVMLCYFKSVLYLKPGTVINQACALRSSLHMTIAVECDIRRQIKPGF